MLQALLKILWILQVLNWNVIIVSSEPVSYFTSVKKLRELAEIDVKIYTNIINNIDDIILSKGDIISREKMSEWSDEVTKIRNGIDKYVGNPLNAFKIIRRNFIDLASYENIIPGLRKNLRGNGTILPTKEDLVGAVKGLARLQRFYKLKINDLAKGIINGISTNTSLSSNELMTISNQLRVMGPWETKLAREYHELSKNSSYKSESEKLFDESFVKTGVHTVEKEQYLFQQSCRGEIRKTPVEQSKLYCYYHSTNAFTKLARFKAEIFNVEPTKIIVIKDIISDEEIKEVLQIHWNGRTVDSTVGRRNGRELDQNLRVSATDKILERDFNILKRLSSRMDVS